MPRIQKGLAQLPQLPRVFALVWAAAPAWTICWGVCLAIQGLLPAAIVYLSRSIVNGVTAAIRNGGAWRDLRSVLLLLAAIAVLALAAELLRGLTVYARTAQSELLADEISSLVHRKSISVDLAFYDSAEFYDHLHRARSEAADRPVALLDNAGSLLQDTITLVAMGAILIRFGLWLPLLLLLGTIPALYVVLRYSLIYQEWWRRTTRERRRAWYYEWLVTTGEVAAELRLFSLGEHFRSSYQSVRARLRTQRLDLARSQSFAELGAGALGLTVTGLATAWMIWRTARGLATLGDLAMFYQAFNQGFGLMRGLLGNLGQFYANLLFLGNLFEFLDLRPKVTDPPQPVQTTAIPATEIRFEDVTFLYPGSNRPALENFSLAIPAGGIVAVVGSNGAGKSTLIKLLCRFYDPEAGRLTVDGIDLREFPVAELRRRITVLFQQPVHYNDTVRENIVY